MNKLFKYVIMIMAVTVTFSIISCGDSNDDTEDEISINKDNNDKDRDNNDNEEDNNKDGDNTGNDEDNTNKNLFEIDTDNLFVGNWIECSPTGSYTFYSFCSDGTYREEVRTSSAYRQYSGTYTCDGTTLALLQSGSTKSSDKKIYELSEEVFHFGSYYCQRTNLSSLAEGDQPSNKETALRVQGISTDLGYGGVLVCPYWGVSYVLYTIDEDFSESSALRFSNTLDDVLRKECKYNPGTTHTFTAVAYDKQGNAFKKYQTTFTMPGEEITNYYFFRGKQYPLYSAEMSVKHDHSGTNTGSNFKYLKFISDSENRVQFEYAVHEWESIDKEWAEGTYKIGDSSNYYTYGCLVVRSGHANRETSGKLKIKKTSSKYMTFDFTLEETRGHFEGTVE